MADIDLIELLNGVDINGSSSRARNSATAALAAATGGNAEYTSTTASTTTSGRDISRVASPTATSPLPLKIAAGVFRDERGIPTDR